MTSRKNMFSFAYPAEFEPDDNDTVIITFPDVPGAISYGEDEDDALRHGLDALITIISAYIDDGKAISEPTRPKKGQRTVTLPPLEATKTFIYMEMRRQRVTKAEMVRRLGQDPKQIDRLLDVLHSSRHDQLDKALAALGKKLEISVKDIAA